MKQFTVTDVTYHRNGCTGRGFYSVRFSFKEDVFQPNMVAIMPDVINNKSCQECFVMNLNDPTSNWRGDQFAYDVRAAIERFSDDLQASFKST